MAATPTHRGCRGDPVLDSPPARRPSTRPTSVLPWRCARHDFTSVLGLTFLNYILTLFLVLFPFPLVIARQLANARVIPILTPLCRTRQHKQNTYLYMFLCVTYLH